MSDNKTKVKVCVTAEYNNETGKFSEEKVDITVGNTTNIENAEKAAEVIGKLSGAADATGAADGIGATGIGNDAKKPSANATANATATTNPDATKPATAPANPDANANATNSGAVKDGAQDKSDANTVAGDLPKIDDKFTMTQGNFKDKTGIVQNVNKETKTVELKFDNGQTINQTYDALQNMSIKVKSTTVGGRSKAKRRRPKRVGTKKKKHTKRQRRYGSKTKKC